MQSDIIVSCECGSVEGVAHKMSAGHVNRFLCYCESCQAFAEFLGKTDRLLDKEGGFGLVQMSPGQLEFTKGKELVTCLRLTPKGPIRWYTSCCKTGLANTLATNAVPFMAFPDEFFKKSSGITDLKKNLGPIRAKVNSQMPQMNTPAMAMIPIVIRFVSMLLKWRITGEYKKSPFFNSQTGEPIVEPILLPKDEVQKLKDKRAKNSA